MFDLLFVVRFFALRAKKRTTEEFIEIYDTLVAYPTRKGDATNATLSRYV
jgi:hypothetical protein